MKQLLTLLFLFFWLSCQQTPQSPENHPEKSGQQTDSSLILDQNPQAVKPDSSSLNSGDRIESGITPDVLSKIENKWANSRVDKFLLKKNFTLLSKDTLSEQAETILYGNSRSGETIEISITDSEEGDHSFVINYYMASQAGYDNFIDSLRTSPFQYSKRNGRYEIYMGTYEDKCIYTKGSLMKKGRELFWVQYLHSLGKELSEIPPPDEDH